MQSVGSTITNHASPRRRSSRRPGSSARESARAPLLAGKQRLALVSVGGVCSLANDPLDPVGEAAPVGNRFGGGARPSEGTVDVGDDLCGAMGSDDATKPSPVRKMRLCVPDPVLQAPAQCGGRRLGHRISPPESLRRPSSSGAHARAGRPSRLRRPPSRIASSSRSGRRRPRRRRERSSRAGTGAGVFARDDESVARRVRRRRRASPCTGTRRGTGTGTRTAARSPSLRVTASRCPSFPWSSTTSQAARTATPACSSSWIR